MLKTSLRKIDITDSIKKYKVVITDETPSKMELQDGRERQFKLLKQLIDNPTLLFCGPLHFQSLKMTHNGDYWVIEMEATHKAKEE